MRTYYVFKVKDEFKSLYRENQSILYHIFKQIYLLKKEDLAYGYSLFRQLTKKIDKEKLDKEIFISLHGTMPYSKRKNKHHINNLYKDETSSMIIKHAYIQIESNQDNSEFLHVLNQFENPYFVCDFQNQDYFFLEDLKVLV